MRVSLKAKLTGLISFLVLLVVVVTSTLYLSSLTRQALTEVERKGLYVASEIFHQAQSILAQSRVPAGANPADVIQSSLSTDKGLISLLESAVGYSATLYYVCITDERLRVLVHNDPGEQGRVFTPAPPFREVVAGGLLRQLEVIYGPPRVYEVVFPVKMGEKPVGDVRVGVSTLFLRDQITPELRKALALSALAIVLATISAGLLSFRVLRPLETISRGVDRMARGEYHEPLQVKRADEWGILSSKLNLLGEQMRGEKAAFVELKENLDQLFANLADGLLMFDKQDRLVLATPAAGRFLERPIPALLRQSSEQVFSGGSPLNLLLREAFREHRPVAWRLVELPRESLRVAVTVQFAEAQGERVASLVTLRDATTRARLHDQMDLSAKQAAIGRLTSGVAHEVKNPLNAMVLQLELLRTKLAGEDERVAPHLDTLSAEVRRLDRVVKTFLDFTRPVELRLAETDLATLVREVFTLAEPKARQNNVRLVFEADGAVPHLRLDPDLMKQALLNLVLNGCEAMPSGGELKVRPRAAPHRVELEIADQGVGIPPNAHDKIFTLYFTTKPGGTGIGLAMSYRIIELHNGSIDFSSEPDHGTTFRVSLPA